jgi:glutathione S-transferase
LAEPIRLLLVYTGTEFEDKRFYTGDAPDFQKSDWLDNKLSYGLDFPNLPFYIDGEYNLILQSMCCFLFSDFQQN